MPASAGDASARGVAEALDEVEDAQDLGAVADHLTVAGLSPAQHAVAVDDERRAPGDVAVGVEDAVRVDGPAVEVAQQREREPPRRRKGRAGLDAASTAAPRSPARSATSTRSLSSGVQMLPQSKQ